MRQSSQQSFVQHVKPPQAGTDSRAVGGTDWWSSSSCCALVLLSRQGRGNAHLCPPGIGVASPLMGSFVRPYVCILELGTFSRSAALEQEISSIDAGG